MKTFALAGFLFATTAFGQSVEVATQKHPQPAASAQAPSFAARCSTCTERIEGTVTVDREGVRFCCASWIKAGSKVAVRCPYSFTVPLTGVTEQYLEKEAAAWHVVSQGIDYSFAGKDAAAMKAAYERLKALRSVPSHFADHFENELATLQKPAPAPAAECH